MNVLSYRAACWLVGLGCVASSLGCEVLLGYDDLKPRRADAGRGSEDDLDASVSADADTGEPELDAEAGEDTGEPELDAGQPGAEDADAQMTADPGDAAPEAGVEPDAGQCLTPSGQDLCAAVPKFTTTDQVVDGAGDEFCSIRAMTFAAVSCPTVSPEAAPALPANVSLRVAWSEQAVHLHVRVLDPSVIVQADRAKLWDGDAVEIYIAGANGAELEGAFDGTNDGGAIQLVLTPPSGAFPARGEAFFSRLGEHAAINPSLYAGRLIPGGYELELRFPWPPTANLALPGARVAFDFALDVQDTASAGGRQLQCVISDVFVDGSQACGFAPGTPAAPYCDDRSWCQPELSP